MNEIEKNNLEVLEVTKKIQDNQLLIQQRQEDRSQEEHSLKMAILRGQYQEQVFQKVEPSALTEVEKFHDLFGHPILYSPALPSQDRLDLRINLMQEELDEIKQAFEDKNLIEAADGLGDLLYVLAGTVLELGLKDRFKEVFDEIQRSNMSKACKTMEEAEKTVAHYKEKGVEAYVEDKGDRVLVFRYPDHKVLKSVDYSPASLIDKVLGLKK